MKVINGTDVTRLGRAVERDLLNRGFDSYGVGDTSRHYDRTTVVDLKTPDGRNGQAVAQALAVQRYLWWIPIGRKQVPPVVVSIDSSQFIDVFVIVGDDYQKFFPGVIPIY